VGTGFELSLGLIGVVIASDLALRAIGLMMLKADLGRSMAINLKLGHKLTKFIAKKLISNSLCISVVPLP
jgi:hypothetical protein